MRHRHALAAAIFLALTVLHTWPLATDPARMSRIHDDEWLNAWAVSWIAHQLPRAPLDLFDANMFHPAEQAMRYTEPLVVPALIGAPFYWLGASPLLTHNLLVLAGLLLTALAMHRLVVHWTGDFWSGILAGALLTFGTAMATRIAHIQFLHFYAFPFAVLALDRLLTGGRARDAAWVGVWVTVAALTSGYLVVLVVVALGAAFVLRAGDWWGRRATGIAVRLAGAAAVTGAVLLLLMRPYLGAELRRASVTDAGSIGESLLGFLRTAADLHYGLWSERFWSGDAPSAMFPGVVAIVLAGAAFATRGRYAPRGVRRMLIGIGAVGAVLSLGMLTPVYGWLATVLPPLLGLRSPSRFAMLTIFALAALAGIGWSAVRERLNPPWRTAAAVGLLALATVESLHAPLPYRELTRDEWYPPIYGMLEAAPPGPIAELPVPRSVFFHENARYLLASTQHWRPILNGFGGFYPESYAEAVRRLATFPSDDAVDYLRSVGVQTVIVHGNRMRYFHFRRVLAEADRRSDVRLEARLDRDVIYRIAPHDGREMGTIRPGR
ncbi:MAG: hypothetical protein F4W89_07320 [Acidobacteria bacterium]|nr:hypothetical protein [Acidobacteriota bacterium]